MAHLDEGRTASPLGLVSRGDLEDCCWELLLPDGFDDTEIDRVSLVNLGRREPRSVSLLFPELVSRLSDHVVAHSDVIWAQSDGVGALFLRLFSPGRRARAGRPRDDDAEVKVALYKHLRETVGVSHIEAIRQIKELFPEVSCDKAIEMTIKRHSTGPFAFVTSSSGQAKLRDRARPLGLEMWPELAKQILSIDYEKRSHEHQGNLLRNTLNNAGVGPTELSISVDARKWETDGTK